MEIYSTDFHILIYLFFFAFKKDIIEWKFIQISYFRYVKNLSQIWFYGAVEEEYEASFDLLKRFDFP